MKQFTILLSLLLIAKSLFGQVNDAIGISKDVKKIVMQIAEEGIYTSSAIGYGGEEPKQWQRYEKLYDKASNKELIVLTDNLNPAVRCYAFQALVEKKNEATYDILVKHLKDNDTIKTLKGCIMSFELIGDFFLNLVTPGNIPENGYKLNKKELIEIDSILIFDPEIKLVSKSIILAKIEPVPVFYNRIKSLFLKDNDPNALIALSKYNKDEDKKIIIDWMKQPNENDLYYGLIAVRHFPDDSFFPLIKEIQQQELKELNYFNNSFIRELYFAIVQYKNQASKDLLENTLNTAKGKVLEHHSKFIWLALKKYPAPIFKGIKEKIKISKQEKNDFEFWLKYDM